MSSGLYWEPTKPPDKKLHSLKFLFRELYGDPVDVKLTADNDRELRAALAATADLEIKKEIQAVLAAIEAFGEITVKEKW